MPRASGPRTGKNFAEVIFEQYHAELDQEGLGETNEQYKEGVVRLQDFISCNEYSNNVCLVCLETIAPGAAVWTCRTSCFCMLHLVCAQGWANQQLKTAAAKAASQAANPDLSQGPVSRDRAAPDTWGCPKCRVEYQLAEAPRQYLCMCGKVADPPFDPWLLPHTCGAKCERQLQPPCGHDCVLLCHPGPCPPCPRQVTAACYCGKAKARRRCGAAKWSCTRLCGRAMPCSHRCPQKCHNGDCGPCSLTGTYSCRCGSTTETRSCQERDFQCGKVMHSDLPCDQEAPPCGATCGKLLPCRRHHCQERCHFGPCPEACRLLMDKSCACGHTLRRMPCSQPLRCERRCTATRSCGRHLCKRRCCDGNCPPCDQPCGKKLRCGNHLCPSPCHAGPCQPCSLSVSIACACGQTSFITPCGTEAFAKPPPCSQDCPVPRTCVHAKEVAPHPCHFGACPSCPQPCGKQQECGHVCSARCHQPRPPPIPEYTAPLPPISPGIQLIKARKAITPQRPPALQVAEEVSRRGCAPTACPPCQQLLTVSCYGGHATSFQHCSVAAPFACPAACGRLLPCGNHTCAAQCHPVDAADPGASCTQCELPCQRPRSCNHPCTLPCHPGDCRLCEEEVRQPCHCTRSTISAPCDELQQAKREGPDAMRELLTCGKVCHRLLEACPHLCTAICHAGSCPSDCSAPITVRCGCRRKKEKRPCSLVRQQLQDKGLPAVIDESSAVQLLGCDSKCQQLKEEKQQKAEQSQKAPEASAFSSSSMSPLLAAVTEKRASLGKNKERRKATREERAAERERALLKKQRAEHWQGIKRNLWRWLPLILLGLLSSYVLVQLVKASLGPSNNDWIAAQEQARASAATQAELDRLARMDEIEWELDQIQKEREQIQRARAQADRDAKRAAKEAEKLERERKKNHDRLVQEGANEELARAAAFLRAMQDYEYGEQCSCCGGEC